MRIWKRNIVLLFVTYLLATPIASHSKESKISSSEKNHISMIFHNEQTAIAIEKIKESCGVNSCYIILNFLNKNPNYSNLYKKLVPTKYSKVSIADLEMVLSEYDIKVHTLELRPSQLYENPNCLFIMYTPPPKNFDIGHFSVVRAIDENNLQLINPPYPPKILKKSDWVSDDKIIFTAIGDNFIPPSKFTQLNITATILIFCGAVLLAYGKFSNCKLDK